MLGYFRQCILNHLRSNIVAYFFIILIFIIGVVVGALAAKSLPDEPKNELIGYLQVFFQGLSQNPAAPNNATMFSSVLYNNLKSVGLMWILGFTVIGLPAVLFIVFTRGFVIGFTVGFLVNEYIVRGLVFALASVLPHNFLAVPAVLVTGVAATSFSLLLVRHKLQGRINLLYETVTYTVLCAGMLALMVLASVIEVYVSPVFMKMLASLLLKE
ncbi:stage ii sporulation protein m [Lucifera butyrica]|uniref:Stage ii sporulation protein m n=1 Tax=Lucifera butyrica TaxID=1351585 RepID=A0A498RD45_9FIRM|nr:stage II sporulation protein M [Lucifera butyrica]VBB07993.1 stage ii sporulation protein m [Lucifera butyrica]